MGHGAMRLADPAEMAPPRAIIVFDSECVLCSRMVAFILAHEREAFFHFAGAWSPTGLALAGACGFSRQDLNRTFLVIIDGVAHHRSAGGIEILRRLRAPWRFGAITRLCPRAFRDPVYDALARRRIAWFGKGACFVPPPDQTHRFLDWTPG